jgi:integrase
VRPKSLGRNGNYRFCSLVWSSVPCPSSASTPKYRLHKASQKALVTIQGRDFYLGPWKSKASYLEYDRLIGEWLANGRQLPRDLDAGLDITELLAAYWQFAEGYYMKDGRPTCLAGIKVALRFLRQIYGDTSASDFGPLALQALQMRMVEAGQSRRYINCNIGHIRRCFKWAVARELLSVSVFEALRTVPGLKRGRTAARETAPVRPAADQVVDATLPYLPPVVADMVRFQRLVGCRPGEVCNIRPCEIDTSGDVWRYVPGTHKTQHHGRERVIFIGPQAQVILRPYLLRNDQTYCFSPVESRSQQYTAMRERRRSKVQPSQTSRAKRRPRRNPQDHYTKDSYNRAIVRGCMQADRQAHAIGLTTEKIIVPVWHPNQLRHALATSVRRLYGVEAAQVVLGHSHADVTQVYAERDLSKAEAVMRLIG